MSVDLDFFIRRLKYAQESRDGLIKRQGLTGYRLCAAESDGLPGLTIDRYADFLVCQILRRCRVPARADHASTAYPLPRVQHL
jgi:23S rRNA G2069 N7-methylase RlmK/C1962 C5-methylase RlmI